ncbi:MAG: hypothetical protein H6815_08215 [Phycisphaeraceae bacterium]|nr:hypothetical protein [Phycisphaerales bacterium]MCB9860424.1 hypothetical protein [Phycisphaeraceae bacterium]
MSPWDDLIEEIDDQKQPEKTGRKSNSGVLKIVLFFVLVGVIVVIALPWIRNQNPSSAAVTSTRLVMDAETGEIFDNFRVPKDQPFPWKNPKTGRNTLYMPEKCYWTPDGKAKNTPDYVLLNKFTGKAGPTLCPVCGKEVREHNPTPPDELLVEAFNEGR